MISQGIVKCYDLSAHVFINIPHPPYDVVRLAGQLDFQVSTLRAGSMQEAASHCLIPLGWMGTSEHKALQLQHRPKDPHGLLK